MTGSVLDILIYVFDQYMLAEAPEVPERETLAADLERAGFGRHNVERALDWLADLAGERSRPDMSSRALRVFSADELERISTSCRGYLLQLEQEGILSPLQREIVIDRLVALDGDDVDIDRLKWLVLMVLSSQPGQEQACARMEDLLFDESGCVAQLMAENLVIVESPAKAKTIKKYLGKDFEVLASYGHVRDLIPKEGAVDPDKQFAMSYRSIERNEKHVDAISRALKKSKNLYLATDPDREGEAISWHLRELLEERGELKGKDSQTRRVLRNHQGRSAARRRRAARPVARPGERAAGAPRARLPRRLQSLAAAVEEGAPRPVRRPRAEPGAAHDLRARARDQHLQAAGILDARSRRRTQRADLPAQAGRIRRPEGRAVQLHQRRRGARRRKVDQRCRAGFPARHVHRPQAAPPQSFAAFHHLHAAAGSRAQARLFRPAHHAPGAAAV